jgi:polyisoprenyl-teichoic acid--peptidoglycan teichoic acid transferase
VAGAESVVVAFARRYLIALMLASVVMVGAVVFVNYIGDTKFDRIEKVDVNTTEAPTEVTNFLLIGSDTRAFVSDAEEEKAFGSASGEAAGERSDTLMVIHVDPNKQRALVVSFPRDLWVEIPGVPLDNTHCSSVSTGKCMSKINSAFSNGPDTVIATLQTNYGIPINHYIEVDFKTFEGIVDAIGDVPIYFPYPTRDDDTGLFAPNPGCHLLDGKGALAYARARHIEYYSYAEEGWHSADATADLARIKRQQDFMRRLASLAVQKSSSNPLVAIDVVNQVVDNLKIDQSLTKDQLLGLVDVFSGIDINNSEKVQFLTLPARNGSAGSLSVLYVDEASAPAVLDALKEDMGNTDPGTAVSTTTLPVDPSVTTVPTAAATTTTTSPVLPVSDQDRFGVPAEVTPPCG